MAELGVDVDHATLTVGWFDILHRSRNKFRNANTQRLDPGVLKRGVGA